MDNTPQFNDILFYTSPKGTVKIEVIYENETFWLSQKRIIASKSKYFIKLPSTLFVKSRLSY